MNIQGLLNDDPYIYESCHELPIIQFHGGSTPARSQSAAGQISSCIRWSLESVGAEAFEHHVYM